MKDGEVTSEGKRLIDAWLGALQRIAGAKRELNSAECDENNTRRALAKWLTPDDAVAGEKIAVWYSDSLIQVTVPTEIQDPVVTIRQRGKGLRAA
jgi:hypothetical protein